MVRLSDVNTEDQAKGLSGKDVASLTDMAPLPEGKFYFHEVQGLLWIARAAMLLEPVCTSSTRCLLHVGNGLWGRQWDSSPAEHVNIVVKRESQTLVLVLPDGLLDVFLGNDDTEQDGGEDDWEVPV